MRMEEKKTSKKRVLKEAKIKVIIYMENLIIASTESPQGVSVVFLLNI